MLNNRENTISAYITNLGKYNEGELVGKWVSFPISQEEQAEIFEEIGISEEPDENGQIYEEYFMSDYEITVPGLRWDDLGEYASIETLNEYAEAFEELDQSDADLVGAILEAGYYSNILDAIENKDNYYLIDVDNDYDLGYYWIEESGCYNTAELGALSSYIDYERFGRDCSFDGSWTSYGFLQGC